jgi:hypothetical protein
VAVAGEEEEAASEEREITNDEGSQVSTETAPVEFSGEETAADSVEAAPRDVTLGLDDLISNTADSIVTAAEKATDGETPASPPTIGNVVEEVVSEVVDVVAGEPETQDEISISDGGPEEPQGDTAGEKPPEEEPSQETEGTVSEAVSGSVSQSVDSGTGKSESTKDIFHDTQIKEGATAVAVEPRPSAPVQEVPIATSDPDVGLDNALTLMVRKRILPDPAIRFDVCNYGRKKSAQLLLAEQYDEAAAIDIAVDIIFVNIRQDDQEQDAQGQTLTLQQRLDEAKRNGEEINQVTDAWIEMSRQKTRETLQKLEEFHAQEREEFEQFWARPEAKVPFSKPSPELLQARQKQKAAALVHDFASAKAMKLQAEALERKESAEGARRFANALTIAYEQLIDRQQKEIDCAVAKGETNVAVLTQAKEMQVLSNERTKRSLELRITSPKQMKRPTIQLPVVKPRGATATVATPGMITHRTRAQLAGYRKSPEMTRLQIPPQDPQAVLRISARRPPTVPLV